MKKFYSDIVKDLLPDDSVASGKPLPVSMLHEYALVCSFKKKRGSFSRKTRDVKQEEEVTEGEKSGSEMNFDADDYDTCTSPRQYSYGGPYRRTQLGRKQNSRKEEIVQITWPYIHKDSTSLSMVHTTRVRNDVGAVNSSDCPLGEVARLNSKEECQKDDRTDDFRNETDEDLMQTSSRSVPEQLSGRSVEESCIIVYRDELHCVFPDRKENDKHKSFKIRDAISSRMKQNREKEYKRLARQWYTEDVENGRDNPKQIEESQSLKESEWELL